MNHTIHIVPGGGLANRMRAIASTFALAKDTGCKCCIEWNNNDDLKADFYDLFNSNPHLGDIHHLATPFKRFLYSMPRKRNLFLPICWQKIKFGKRIYDAINTEYYQNHPKHLVEDIKKSTKDIMIFSGLCFYPFSKTLYRELFSFSPEVIGKAKYILSHYPRPDYGMHIRRTDNTDSIKESPLEVFEKKVKQIIARNPAAIIFIASDDQEVKSHMKKKFENNIIFNSAQADRKSKTGMIDAAAEMLILSQTKEIFGSYWSSFSEAAAIIGGIPLTICRNEQKSYL